MTINSLAPLTIIIAEVLILLLLCIGFDLKKMPFGKHIALLMVVLANIFVFPHFFYPEYNQDGVKCGLPYMAIGFIFYIAANVIAAITVLLYQLAKNMIS